MMKNVPCHCVRKWRVLAHPVTFISHMGLHRAVGGGESVSGRLTARWSQQERSDAQVLPNVAIYIYIYIYIYMYIPKIKS